MMKITKALLTAVVVLTIGGGYSAETFNLSDLKNYHKEFKSESIGACSQSSTKTYEDYRAITNTASVQYRIIHEEMTVDPATGFLLDKDGFMGVAMGYQFGELGSRYYVELDSGIVVPVKKIDAKAAEHAQDGCSAGADASVIEFVIDSEIGAEYFGNSNGLVSWGNFNNYDALKGNIVDIEKVSDEKLETGVVYHDTQRDESQKADDFTDSFALVSGGY